MAALKGWWLLRKLRRSSRIAAFVSRQFHLDPWN
jgi:hypothetical protein